MYLKLAEKGLSFCLHKVGSCYYNGDSVGVDKVKVVEWYINAARQGNKYGRR